MANEQNGWQAEMLRKLNEATALIDEVRTELDSRAGQPEIRWSGLERGRYHAGDDHIDLSPTEAEILGVLLKSRHQVVPTADLCRYLGLNLKTQQASVKSYVSRLRKKLNSMDNPDITIMGIRSAGYTIVELAVSHDR